MDKSRYSEDDLLPLSYLSQYYYCKRRVGLIMLEQQWADNFHTAKGEVLHQRVHELGRELRNGQAQLRNIPLRSFRLGLSGNSDCVELLASEDGFSVPGLDGSWLIYPIEYKSGKKRSELEYEVQLCAQAICLEEMWNCKVEEGYLYYGKDRKRMLIKLSHKLRQLVLDGAEELHQMLASGVTPLAAQSGKCRECSLAELCMPSIDRSACKYLEAVRKALESGVDN